MVGDLVGHRAQQEALGSGHAPVADHDQVTALLLGDIDDRVGRVALACECLDRGDAGATSSISRLLITAFEQDIHEFAVDLLGPAGLLGKSAPQAVQRSRWLLGFLRTRASTIGAGTREIQLNTVAEQVLGLPHDPGLPR